MAAKDAAMPSPFPGMNPYLEQDDAWHDFHHRFATAAAEVIAEQVRPRYLVKIDENLFIHELPAERRGFLSAVDIERQPFVEIRDRASRQVIAIIELLSPSNKYAGADREQYLAKRGRVLHSPTHLVEIDLMRGGGRMPGVELGDASYGVLVSRSQERPRADLWPIGLRERLPVVPIPLREGEPEASLDLESLLHRIYDAAGYEDYIYAGRPQLGLSGEDAVWAAQFVPRPATSG
jgi:hypothetical protein